MAGAGRKSRSPSWRAGRQAHHHDKDQDVSTSPHDDTCPAGLLGPLGGICNCTTTTRTRPSSDVEDHDQNVAMIGVVASNHDRIRDMTTQHGIDHRNVVAIPARTVDTATRGRVLDAQLADHTATHVDPPDVHPATTASAAPVYALDLPRGSDPHPGPTAPPMAKATLPLAIP